MACTIKECKNNYYAKGYCQKHYDNNRRRGDPTKDPILNKNLPCIIVGCSKLRFANDLCAMHNGRRKRHGDPNYINPKCNRDGNYKKRALAKSASWKSENRALNSQFNTARKNKINKASLGGCHKDAIIDIYLACPEGFAVDHIIPINHKDVCGLHVPWNLQYLSKWENAHKSNKFDGTYENESWLE